MYLEHAARADSQRIVACTWQHTSAVSTQARVVPDACVDIVWTGAGLHVAGPDTGPVTVEVRAGTRLLGLRFVPGAAGALLGVPASALRDARAPLCELWGESAHVLEQRLHAAADTQAALSLMEAAVLERMRASAPIDPVARLVAGALRPQLAAAASQVPSVAQLSAAIGIGERQLLRRCDAAFGYGPKLLARVLRFQAFVAALRTRPDAGLAELASLLGYTDQAHLAHDTAELAGQTPRQLRTRWAPEGDGRDDGAAPCRR